MQPTTPSALSSNVVRPLHPCSDPCSQPHHQRSARMLCGNCIHAVIHAVWSAYAWQCIGLHWWTFESSMPIPKVREQTVGYDSSNHHFSTATWHSPSRHHCHGCGCNKIASHHSCRPWQHRCPTPHSAVNGEKDSRMIHIFAKFFFVKKLKKKDCTCAHSGGPEHISAKTRVVGAPHSTPHNNTLALY
jgi:hypothetical protein